MTLNLGYNTSILFRIKIMDNKNEVQDTELIDIEDIVPFDGNSLFLSIARVLIYTCQKKNQFANALNMCFNLSKNDLLSDINLQNVLRTRLCEFWLKSGIHFDEKRKMFCLSK